MAIQATGYLVGSNESGSFLDGFWGWAGDRVTSVSDQYVSRWLDDRFPETVQPFNPDEPLDNVSMEQESVSSGFMGDPGNQKLLMLAGLGLLAFMVLK
ncbi:MAG: hypothetical protein KZQ94_20930 [Candidatus Thiodiazotropha sp. (ex Troendleina suluensis)]|nr:hypothetical protein [Candidatus Thiodiazotropha sp. (ex Troendleina suluensis)]